MARKSRSKRRREAKKRRVEGPAAIPPGDFVRDENGAASVIAREVDDMIVDTFAGPTPQRATPADPAGDDRLDARDDLSDTHGEKIGKGRTKEATKLMSSAADGLVPYTVRIKPRFATWLEQYAKRHDTTPEQVFDFAMRQIWKDDEDRLQGDTMTQVKWQEISAGV